MPDYKQKFQNNWLLLKDSNGDSYSEYIVRKDNDEFNAVCNICKGFGGGKGEIRVDNNGQNSLLQHSKTKGHRDRARNFFKRSTQSIISFSRPASETSMIASSGAQPATSSESSPNTPSPAVPSSSGSSSSTFQVLVARDKSSVPSHTTQVAKAEIRLCLASIETGVPYGSMEKLIPVMKMIDPDLKVWSGVSLSRKKMSYSISDGLGPYFHQEHMTRARAAPGFSISLDAATSKRGGLKKELDLRISFWDKFRGRAVDHILDIQEITNETAKDLLEAVLASLDENGLEFRNIVAISRDNPNVNKALVKMMKDEALRLKSKIVDYGSCVLHVADNSFKKGIKKFSLDISRLAKSMFGFFKYSTIRREEFSYHLIDLDLEDTNYLRHVDSRWVQILVFQLLMIKLRIGTFSHCGNCGDLFWIKNTLEIRIMNIKKTFDL